MLQNPLEQSKARWEGPPSRGSPEPQPRTTDFWALNKLPKYLWCTLKFENPAPLGVDYIYANLFAGDWLMPHTARTAQFLLI